METYETVSSFKKNVKINNINLKKLPQVVDEQKRTILRTKKPFDVLIVPEKKHLDPRNALKK